MFSCTQCILHRFVGGAAPLTVLQVIPEMRHRCKWRYVMLLEKCCILGNVNRYPVWTILNSDDYRTVGQRSNFYGCQTKCWKHLYISRYVGRDAICPRKLSYSDWVVFLQNKSYIKTETTSSVSISLLAQGRGQKRQIEVKSPFNWSRTRQRRCIWHLRTIFPWGEACIVSSTSEGVASFADTRIRLATNRRCCVLFTIDHRSTIHEPFICKVL